MKITSQLAEKLLKESKSFREHVAQHLYEDENYSLNLLIDIAIKNSGEFSNKIASIKAIRSAISENPRLGRDVNAEVYGTNNLPSLAWSKRFVEKYINFAKRSLTE